MIAVVKYVREQLHRGSVCGIKKKIDEKSNRAGLAPERNSFDDIFLQDSEAGKRHRKA